MDPIALRNGFVPYNASSRRGVASSGMADNSAGAASPPVIPAAHAASETSATAKEPSYVSRMRLRRFVRHGLLPQLFVFEAVARLGSVTRAAEEMHLAQPTVSLQLKKLAEALEVTLFEQRGRRLHLTPAGHTLRDVCDELIHCLSRAEQKLAAFRHTQSETLRLAAEPELRLLASRLIADFCACHPGLRVALHVADRVELFQRLSCGADDLVLFELGVESLPVE